MNIGKTKVAAAGEAFTYQTLRTSQLRKNITGRLGRLGLVVAILILFGVSANSRHVTLAADWQTEAMYGRLPLSFAVNAGQAQQPVRFQVRDASRTLSFQSDSVLLTLPVMFAEEQQPLESRFDLPELPPNATYSVPQVTVELHFEGANPNTTVEGTMQLLGVANFFIGNDPSRWHTDVPTYASVIYRNLYAGVDLQYTGNTGLLKGTYTLAAGTILNTIRWRYAGATSVSLDPITGDLDIKAPGDVTLVEQAPSAWQIRSGVPTLVTVRYHLNGDGSIQFTSSSYDPALPLIIDPGLDYSTYLGGSGTAIGYGIAVDDSGNAYIVGYTASAFPITSGAYGQTFKGGNSDVFVSKLNPSGTALVYSTYLGGSSTDQGLGIALDGNHNVYVTGCTLSPDFPVTPGAFQTALAPEVVNPEAFVSKLSAAGDKLSYSTYLGGNRGSNGYGIAVDGSGSAYITGDTGGNFPTTPGALRTRGSGNNAFVTKLNTTGTALVYSTYLGGTNQDNGRAIALDESGNAYIAGYTVSLDFSVTQGAYQTAFGDGEGPDGFVSKLNATGTALMYSTYLGSNADILADGIAIDGSGNAYVTGETSGDFPTTSDAYQATNAGGRSDAFIAKLNATGNKLEYSTYLGGKGEDKGTAITVDGNGNAYVVGSTGSLNFPITQNAFQPNYKSGMLGFISEFDGMGHLLVSSYIGTAGGEFVNDVAIDKSGSAYVVGVTAGNFPTTSGAYQTTIDGRGGSFVVKLNLSGSSTSNGPTTTNPPSAPSPTASASATVPSTVVPAPVAQGMFFQSTTLAPNDPRKGDYFGEAIAYDGNTAVIGAPDQGEGAVYIFTKDGTSWTEQTKLTAPSDGGSLSVPAQFGVTLAISANTVLVGEPGFNNNVGEAVIFTREGTAWIKQATLSGAIDDKSFGVVALNGDIALVGAPSTANQKGVVYVFTRAGTAWRARAILSPRDTIAGDLFGHDVTLVGNMAFISAPGKNVGAGTVYVFVNNGTQWVQTAELTANDREAGAAFGVSPQQSGKALLIGAPGKAKNVGAVYALIGAGASWVQTQIMSPLDKTDPERFGEPISIDGTTALIGASQKSSANGLVYVFGYNGTTWKALQGLSSDNLMPGDQFGYSITFQGNIALIAAPGKNKRTGMVYVFLRN